jgi:hypothetical protein
MLELLLPLGATPAQNIKAVAKPATRQMLERYSHIRSHAKHAPIQALEQQAVAPILHSTGHKIAYSSVRCTPVVIHDSDQDTTAGDSNTA